MSENGLKFFQTREIRFILSKGFRPYRVDEFEQMWKSRQSQSQQLLAK